MILLNINYKRLFLGILTIAMVSCSNPWEDRQNNGDPNLDGSLSEVIAKTPEASKFTALLAQTGYDKVLSESKAYTVFVPTNEAMAQVDPAILNNPEQLVFFVQNHIALTSYSSIRTKATERIKMLSNKYLEFSGTTLIDDATIVAADKYAANGVFHIVNKALTPKLNIWQFIQTQAGASAMSDYLLSLKELNIYKSDAAAKAGTKAGALADSLSNSYLRNVYNLNNEKNSYTLFLMEDAGYDSEVNKLIPYLTKSTVDSTATYARYFTVRDMVFPKAYKPNQLPEKLTTRFGVTVPIDKTQIVGEPIVLSNGIIYRMKKVNVDVDKRILPFKIEGESTNYFIPNNRGVVLYRENRDPNGFLFNDIQAKNTKVSTFMFNYSATDVFSTTYQVYWRAINEQPNVFQQKLLIGTRTFEGLLVFPFQAKIKDFGYKDVLIKNYEDVLLGEFTMEQAGNIDLISLIAAATTTDGNNTITLDYLKFVPVIK